MFRAAFIDRRDCVEQEPASQPALLNSEDPHDDTYFVPLLSFAVAGGHLDLAAKLINRGAAVAPYSAQLMRLAGRARSVTATKISTPETRKSAPLASNKSTRSAAGHISVMKELLERGADRTLRDCDAQTPHNLALAAGKKAACELLNYKK